MKKLALCLVALALIASVASAQPYINISKSKGVEVTNKAVAFDGTTGKYVKAAPILFPTILTVATLPTCGSALFGAYASVTDGNGAADCTIGLSTTDVACYCNGTAWTPVGASVDVSGYVLITKAGAQAITSTGAGNDMTLTSADDLIFAAQDFLPTTTATFAAAVGTNASITTTAGNITLAVGGTTQDFIVTSVDDVSWTITDDVVISAQDFLPSASATQVLTAPVSSIVASTSMLVTSPKTSFSAAVEEAVADVTVADDAGGTKPAGVTPITTPVVTCTCNDATGCTMSVAEPTPTAGYARFLTIVSAGTGNCEYADAAGVTELTGAVVLGPTDTLMLVYANAAWHEIAASNN